MSAAVMEAPQSAAPVLNRYADRCDRCGAQAWVRVQLPSGRTLDFCAHHFRDHEPALAKQGATVVADQREEMNVAPSVSANKD